MGISYKCGSCGKTQEVAPGAKPPVCCGAPMKPGLAEPPPHPMTAEEDRLEDEDGPFDDGVH